MDSLQQNIEKVRDFCEKRDWDQFHSPKDLAIGMSTEANELLDLFRFKSDADMAAMLQDPDQREAIRQEMADVFFFLLRFSQRFDMDILAALADKMAINEEKYPVETSRGRNDKHRDLFR